MNNPELWKGEGYSDPTKPHKILIDGGGIRGMIALDVLESMESLLELRRGNGWRRTPVQMKIRAQRQ